MMKALAERHTGHLPLDTVESIWRVIISTFTYVQAAYEVIYQGGALATDMRDVARFHFGFTVPLVETDGSETVLAKVGGRGDALGLIPLENDGAWWRALEGDHAPKIIARLPFVERDGHPAGTPCLVIGSAIPIGLWSQLCLGSLLLLPVSNFHHPPPRLLHLLMPYIIVH